MRHHPTRTRLLRVTRHPARGRRLSWPATLVLGLALLLTLLFLLSQ